MGDKGEGEGTNDRVTDGTGLDSFEMERHVPLEQRQCVDDESVLHDDSHQYSAERNRGEGRTCAVMTC